MRKDDIAAGSQRCAIYTRKSTEDGLEQEFNSLDAQREACAAYVLSQRHEGWTLNPDLYDDGGFSGGSMDRPGLKRLLADIQAGKVDTIIVYKVDRLTRSLADFAKIVDVLDAAGASFVSITQSFNTTTSMGRLTLNVLLSFAQFEREVTGERIRDKIAASKKKGLWMGGPVPLGYEVQDRKLVVHESEAKLVRHIMQRYLEVGSVRDLIDVLAREGARTKVQVRTSTGHRGGVPFARGGLFHLLKNRIYRAFIIHKGVAHPGEHQAIVPEELWDQVQAKLADNGPRLKRVANTRHPSLLIGLVHDGLGRRMSPSHANKGSKRYRYYITHSDSGVDEKNSAWRVAAHDLERIVIDRLRAFLADSNAVHAVVAETVTETHAMESLLNAASDTALELGKSTSSVRQALLQRFVTRIDLKEEGVEIAVRRASLLVGTHNQNQPDSIDAVIMLEATTVRVRRGHEVRLIIPSTRTEKPVERDGQLAALVAEAHAARAMMLAQPDRSVNQIASDQGKCRTHYAQLVRLSFLAPDIVAMILEGRQPASLNRRKLMAVDLPLAWADQRVALGCN
jgi:site-specific DNA recombinase